MEAPMPKKKTPRPKVQRCVGCDDAPPVAGSHFCAECADEADEGVGRWAAGSPVTLKGEIARLYWFARFFEIDVQALLADTIERRRMEIKTAAYAEAGIEYVRGEPIPDNVRRAIRDAEACRYLRMRRDGARGCARAILAANPGIFESEEDVRQHAKRVKNRDEMNASISESLEPAPDEPQRKVEGEKP
jgi:hypothetical protein